MTINLKNFLSDRKKLSKMGDFSELKQIEGMEVSSVSADLYNDGRDDLTLFYFKEAANYAVAYTSNTVCSETITWNKNNSRKNQIKALLINTRNANTFTGDQGQESLDILSKEVAKTLTIKESKLEGGIKDTIKSHDIIFASTGVIGEKFPLEKVKKTIPDLVDKLRTEQNKMIWIKLASAIMTTDTKPKLSYEEITIGNKIVKMAGIAKGSGMIAPNLATMLSFIFIDVDIPSVILKQILKRILPNTFNAITVDGDTSTNDTVALFSTKKINIGKINNVLDPKIQKIEEGLKKVALNLAKQIVVDGEGAKKFVTVKVINAKSVPAAKNIAFSVANSPLVKTAIAGEDPNWGRIVMGIGKSGEPIDPFKIVVKIGDFIVAEYGKVSSSYDEQKIKEYMMWNSIEIEINLNQGQYSFEAYTCDFTHEYIDINADYRN